MNQVNQQVRTGIGPSSLVVKANRRFLDDVKRLPPGTARKVGDVVDILRRHGAYYPRLETRKVRGNPDDRYRLMDVDQSCRIVAALEGDYVFLEKVGAHDPTERWAEQATLREYEDRVSVTPATVDPKRRRPSTEPIFELGPSLPEIASSEDTSDILADCVDGVLEGWIDGTIEDWMVFLSPVQRRAVDRAVGGPGRVTGGPGTGKTVVALHRAAGFARQIPAEGRVLLTSFVNTVPAVLGGLFERLAPDLADRVECRTVHSLAVQQLEERGTHPAIDSTGQQARARFRRCLQSNPERFRQLRYGARLSEEYVWEEVTRVIEGRGVPDRTAYLALERHGRKRRLPARLRSLIWEVYQEYKAACANPDEPILSWDQVLRDALAVAREQSSNRKYAAIVVDEAQDITEVGLELLLEYLEGGSAGRILVVGDAGQRIYPGGWRLADLGLEIRGRSFALSVCYRSTDEIMQAVGSLGKFLSPEEFGEDGLRSLSLSTVRSGSMPELRHFAERTAETDWIIGQLDPDAPSIDGTAILTFSNKDADDWCDRLATAGLGAVRLQDYHGRPVPGVKVGTFHRSKGLEFERVFLPGLDSSFPYGDRNDPDEVIAKGAALYVAMSRARDHLLISYTGSPSLFLDPVAPYCNED